MSELKTLSSSELNVWLKKETSTRLSPLESHAKKLASELKKQLENLRKEEGFSVLFITHDIGQAQYISDQVLVMKEGIVVEKGPTKEVFLNPAHPYTKNLLASVPSLYRKWELT